MICRNTSKRGGFMSDIKVYLCGGMCKFGKDRFKESNEWRIDIKNKLEELCQRVSCCNPNEHFSFLDLDKYKSEREVMELDLHKLTNANVVLVNFNDPESIGSACELAIAYHNRIPILGLCENGEEEILHPWLKNFCNRIFTDREELVLYFISHYIYY
jgi:hypothetical protein